MTVSSTFINSIEYFFHSSSGSQTQFISSASAHWLILAWWAVVWVKMQTFIKGKWLTADQIWSHDTQWLRMVPLYSVRQLVIVLKRCWFAWMYSSLRSCFKNSSADMTSCPCTSKVSSSQAVTRLRSETFSSVYCASCFFFSSSSLIWFQRSFSSLKSGSTFSSDNWANLPSSLTESGCKEIMSEKQISEE